ncbi:MAG: hypothetical protein R6V34_08035 [Bacteroidales bacterium]
MSGNEVKRHITRRLGYKNDQQGIINRYLREMGQWDSHLWRCRKYILDSVDLHKPDIITFLGSGWLLDIPLEEAAKKCRKVRLVDVLHPPQVRHKVSKIDNVELYSQDITGGALTEIWDAYRKGTAVSSMEMPVYDPGFEAGLVFSVNILTQLDSLPVDYLVRKGGMSYKELRLLRKNMQRAHTRYLKAVDSVLITDYVEYLKTEDEIVADNKLVFCSLPEGKRVEEWIWEFDNSGNYYSGKRVIFGVKALDLVKE